MKNNIVQLFIGSVSVVSILSKRFDIFFYNKIAEIPNLKKIFFAHLWNA